MLDKEVNEVRKTVQWTNLFRSRVTSLDNDHQQHFYRANFM